MADITQKENSMGTHEMSKLILFTGISLLCLLFVKRYFAWQSGGFALGFCRNIQQAGESESVMDRFYSCGVYRNTSGNVVLEKRV